MTCSSCSKEFSNSPTCFDLCVLPSQSIAPPEVGSSVLEALGELVQRQGGEGSGKSRAGSYRERNWSVSQLFQSPAISYVYERGWRQGFEWAGFPGKDEEFRIMQRLYEDTRVAPRSSSESVLDVSCGTGLFSRKFLRSGMFQSVVASDYSQNMLDQAFEFLNEREDTKFSMETSLTLVRADVGRLPFQSKSFELVHAGAAIHCWPTPSMGIAEICRVLKPGGRLIGSTFLLAASPLGQRLGDDSLVKPLFELEKEFSGGLMPGLTGRQYRFWSEEELRALCELCGLENFQVERDNRFIMFCATKPLGKKTGVGEDKDAPRPEDYLRD
ncbi:S-adenosyl-L-methionine-dependent methyltransferase [Chloropicon primus]|uniref:S-adenosyl-L-methionine-dependent methyltransferase n=1 Tax=Chloropicon primus TaxID=1764295 RepID=A0A5B8MP45_9CHLO|nr:S-adenosyl-L-methionine-dependent methyltransferase [Chloropicon primus]UPR01519.1 S-adenosyl-L-methionine-dependent methyltransferase [Chloropicon primus]|eukprot:QDZ22303.1 S-adenosyl-L-methionine-dependent methyltransferase [Chloropicon primus]